MKITDSVDISPGQEDEKAILIEGDTFEDYKEESWITIYKNHYSRVTSWSRNWKGERNVLVLHTWLPPGPISFCN